MVEILTHLYKTGTRPFRSLSALTDTEACRIMADMYVAGSVFWERFEDPAGYLAARRFTEAWVRKEFIGKGGDPQAAYPIYMVLGHPRWLQLAGDPFTLSTTQEIQVPLSIFSECDVSFTYPDSMVTLLLAEEKNPDYYQPDYHGRVFTLSELRRIIAAKGVPGNDWGTDLPLHLANYVEAQVWNHTRLFEYIKKNLADFQEPARS